MICRSTLAAAAILAVTACSSSPSVQDCGSDLECGAGNVCLAGSCVANAPPSAAWSAPAGATTHRVLTLNPTLADPEGRPVTARWSVAATNGGCEPGVEPQDGTALGVVFWCPGTYEATLVPVDDQGSEGAAAVRSFEVTAAVGAPSVSADPTLLASHWCQTGTCLVEGPGGTSSLQLGATATDPAGKSLQYGWIAIPDPAAARDPTLLVTFLPSAAVAAPFASISNVSGGPIAGTHRFRVRVENPDGLIAQAFQDVVVDNGVPTATPGSWLVPHRYEGGLFVAEGDVVTGASDPDGDPLVMEAALAPAPPASCTEEAIADAAAGTVHVRIACTEPADLIGAAPRTLSVSIADVNGATTALSAPLPIENRPPELTLHPSWEGVLALAHRVEPCQLAAGSPCFVSDGDFPFVIADPDGDPVAEPTFSATVGTSQPASAATIRLEGGVQRFRLETPASRPLEFRSAAGATGFRVKATALDAFGAQGLLSVAPLILNRPPIVAEAAPSATVPHSYDPVTRRYLATAGGARFEDPDGDPMTPSVATAGACSSATLDAGRATILCSKTWDFTSGGVPPLASFLAAGSASVAASDGWESVASPTAITLLDQPAAVTFPATTLETCSCVNGVTAAYGLDLYVPIQLADPDGDPALLTVTPAGTLSPAPGTVLPGTVTVGTSAGVLACPAAGCVYGVTGTADSGRDPHALATVKVTATCSRTGLLCQ